LHDQEAGVRIFCQHLLQRRVVHLLFRKRILELAVLVLSRSRLGVITASAGMAGATIGWTVLIVPTQRSDPALRSSSV
ncbi:MAG TPA: hypothetical protein VNQ74_05160, partial [Burkholderiaceae bacterium]|nr:hypothetical protein [Burkholderiaceae bacterium]